MPAPPVDGDDADVGFGVGGEVGLGGVFGVDAVPALGE